MSNKYLEYLKAVRNPFTKLVKLDFLQPDNSTAFSLGNTSAARGYMKSHDTRAFIQDGTLNVSMNNGARRSANIKLSNLDGGFDYAVNKIWFGNKLRLSMGLVLPDGTAFYLPQGVFYIKKPQNIYSPSEKTITLPLVDKWAVLDGTLGGTLTQDYIIKSVADRKNTNVFNAMSALLQLSKYSHKHTNDIYSMIDNVEPIFTTYYQNKKYSYLKSDGSITQDIEVTDLPYDIHQKAGNSIADLMLDLNNTFVGTCGYDQTGAFRVEPSQDDIQDSNKPILWDFSLEQKNISSITETINNDEVFNNILIIGEGLTGYEVWGEASNYDPTSDTNINLIGIKPYTENRADYWNAEQCANLANWLLKRKTILQKSVTIECSQMFHLIENRLIAIKRTDKLGAPVERHLINSFSIPIGETGSMTINATSVNDMPISTVKEYSTQNGLTIK